MKSLLKRIASFLDQPFVAPILLLLGTVLAYGLLAPQVGFYWDDMPMSWIRYQFGPAAMARYFSSNRPVWGLLYQLTTSIFPHIPIYWQIFALFWRWITALLVWGMVGQLWPARRQFALAVSLFFLLYPGFNQQWGAFLYSHFFIVLSFFLFSFLLMLWSFRYPKFFWPLTAAGMLFSALNLWMMEYFFVLELFRPFVIFYFVAQNISPEAKHDARHLTLDAFKKWLPYLVVFLADVYWRLFVFNNQIYQTTLITDLKSAPLATAWTLAKTVLSNLWLVVVQAWLQIFQFPNPVVDGLRTVIFYNAVVLAVLVLVLVILLSWTPDRVPKQRREALWPIGLGLVAMLTAGWPFWLVEMPVSLSYPANRFTLPFMFGASLLLAGLLELIPVRIRYTLTVALVALAAGRQALWADSFRRDWDTQKAMFWQMFWRAPGLQPNTLVLMNQGPLNYYADNSLAAALNWIYDPNNHSDQIHYAFFFPTNRLGGSLAALQPGLPVQYDYLAGMFNGNTSQTVAFYYQPPGCLHLLDPEIDSQNRLIPDASMMREAARLSSSEWITTASTASMPEIYGLEPRHAWCYYFEQADLARQMADWPRVASLGDIAFNLKDHPNDPTERFVFIEGYAHEGNWEKVTELSMQSFKFSPNYVGPLLCQLIDRMELEVTASNVKESSLNDLRTKFSCLP